MKRLFIAIKIIPEESTLEKYFELRQSLNYNKIRWVEPDKLHITIKFLGDTYEDTIPIVSSVIKSTIKESGSFNIELKNVGVFGSRYKPRVIWFGISDNETLNIIANNIIDNLDSNGFKKDRQNFVPHLTVGRVKHIEDKVMFNREIKKYHNFVFQDSLVERLILFESLLTSKGPIYSEIESYNLLTSEN